MIDFSCDKCSRPFSVPDQHAGKRARCACGNELRVPTESTRKTAPTGLRARRLLADEAEMKKHFSAGAIRLVSSQGSPPTVYEVEFRVRSLVEENKQADVHRARIELTSDYPRVGPRCSMLTPAFHPNIDTSSICVGDHWTAGERLSDLVFRIAEMLTYQAYNIRSPLNAKAAMWADLNQDKLPIDGRDVRGLGG
jgi:ubiquitin-protein ligase